MSQVDSMISQFASRTGSSAFPNLAVTRAAFAAQLRERVNEPYKAFQGDTTLCGAVAFLYCVAQKNMVAYAKYVIDLYENGHAWLGHMHVEPGVDCRRCAGIGMAAVDWVALASLRDSSNTILDFDSPSASAAGKTTPRTLAGWFRKSGYFANVAREIGLVDKGVETLLRAQRHRQAGGHPCLFVGASLLGSSGGRAMANHWVVMASDLRVDQRSVDGLLKMGTSVELDTALLKKSLSFDMITWGERKRLPPMTLETFLDYFKGYVVGR